MTDDHLADSIHIFRDHGIVEELQVSLDERGVFLAKSNFTIKGIPVAEACMAEIPMANAADVIFAAKRLTAPPNVWRHRR
jgi:hypothetical protein